jgi:hypothetical protein
MVEVQKSFEPPVEQPNFMHAGQTPPEPDIVSVVAFINGFSGQIWTSLLWIGLQ